MRASTAFFVGIGTVFLAITGGLAGGLVIGNIMSPPPRRAIEGHATEAERLKQPAQPMPAASPLPYTASTLAFTDPSMKAKASPADEKERKAKSSSAASPLPVTKAAASTEETSKPAEHPRQPTQEAQQAAPEKQDAAPAKPANAPEDANAKARSADLKHAGDRRRAGRTERWAARHNYGQGRDRNQDQNPDQAQDQNGSANAEQQARGNRSANYSYTYSDRRYRDDSRGRYRDAARDDDDRGPVDEGPRFGFPRIQLFGPDD